jgi:hypothetical protein
MKVGAIVNLENEHRVKLYKDRLLSGLKSCGINVADLTSTKESNVDLLFIDPSCKEDTYIPKADKYVFFDCEDMTDFFATGPVYDLLKHKVKNYVKYIYNSDITLDPKIKISSFPVRRYVEIGDIARHIPEVSKLDKSFICCTPTWGGFDKEKEKSKIQNLERLKNKEGITPINVTKDKKYALYSQRIDWLNSIRSSELPFEGGIVFYKDNGPYTLENVEDLFPGSLSTFTTNPQTYTQMLNSSIRSLFLLNPTGHDRISYRTFDIMAVGSINVSTDVGSLKAMYMPPVSLIIKDEDDISQVLMSLSLEDKKSLLKESQKNVDLAKSLTPEKIKTDFLNQLN